MVAPQLNGRWHPTKSSNKSPTIHVSGLSPKCRKNATLVAVYFSRLYSGLQVGWHFLGTWRTFGYISRRFSSCITGATSLLVFHPISRSTTFSMNSFSENQDFARFAHRRTVMCEEKSQQFAHSFISNRRTRTIFFFHKILFRSSRGIN